MKIICVAWGSLLWKWEPLKLVNGWQSDGPLLPLEFARDSDDTPELAIVLTPHASPTHTYWSLLDTANLDQALSWLREREKIHPENPQGVGIVRRGQPETDFRPILDWLNVSEADAVIYTALPPKFDGVEGKIPTLAQALDYLQRLPDADREAAYDYLEKVPANISTPYRAALQGSRLP